MTSSLACHFPSRTARDWTNLIERLNKEVKRRADVTGIFLDGASITRLIGAVRFEQNDERQTHERQMTVDAFVCIDAVKQAPILSISTEAI